VSWSLIDVLSIAMVIAVQAIYQYYFRQGYRRFAVGGQSIPSRPNNEPWIRAFAAITTGLLWLKFVSFLKVVNMQLATFVFALVEVRTSIAAFHVPSKQKKYLTHDLFLSTPGNRSSKISFGFFFFSSL
jgi:hypothetical protein